VTTVSCECYEANVKNTAIVTLKTPEMNQRSSVALDVPTVVHHEPDDGVILGNLLGCVRRRKPREHFLYGSAAALLNQLASFE